MLQTKIQLIAKNLSYGFPPIEDSPNAIDLSNQPDLSDPHIEVLCNALATNTKYSGSFILTHTKITDQAAVSIAVMLNTHKHFSSIDIGFTLIKQKGAQLIIDALADVDVKAICLGGIQHSAISM